MMQQDYVQFITFAADGLYSDFTGSVNFSSSGRSLNIGLNTFITTSYLQQSGWYGEFFQQFISFTRSHLEPDGMLLGQVVHRMSKLANSMVFDSRPWQISIHFRGLSSRLRGWLYQICRVLHYKGARDLLELRYAKDIHIEVQRQSRGLPRRRQGSARPDIKKWVGEPPLDVRWQL